MGGKAVVLVPSFIIFVISCLVLKPYVSPFLEIPLLEMKTKFDTSIDRLIVRLVFMPGGRFFSTDDSSLQSNQMKRTPQEYINELII